MVTRNEFFHKDYKKRKGDIALEESLSHEWARGLGIVEVPLEQRPIALAGAAIFLAGLLAAWQIVSLGIGGHSRYAARAESNLDKIVVLPAPRGVISDRLGKVLADNEPVFSALLDASAFVSHPETQAQTLAALHDALGMNSDDVWAAIEAVDPEKANGPMVLNPELTQEQAVKLEGLDAPDVAIARAFRRTYPDGEIFSSVVGYTGFVTQRDLAANSDLLSQDTIGKSGVELFYDRELRGTHGAIAQKRNAKGNVLGPETRTDPKIGGSLALTIDADFQKYFYERMKQGLASLGRAKGVGLALDPENGEVLALINFPVYDNNILNSKGNDDEKLAILNSANQPLFDRAIGGFYSPGSTIKPLVAAAALAEGVIAPQKTIFSPGYIDVPNPYDPSKPTRYLDWRYQGTMDLAAAIAQSSDVYFYEVGGGGPDSKGLGITKLREWWQKFNLGNPTGIDLPHEGEGFLPSPEWKQKKSKTPWLLGDSYNVSIGQGDLLVTPIQLLNYIAAIANGGKMYEPVVNKNAPHRVLADLSYLEPEFKEVRKGMRDAVTSKLGTANSLADLGFPVQAKTGSAQVQNNQQENAFFVGYIPASAEAAAGKPAGSSIDPGSKIAVLVLVENSKEGSLNAVPIAKDVLNWYYYRRRLAVNSLE